MTVDLLDPALHASGRAHAVYAELRRSEPVSRRDGYWAVLRHADVLEVAGDPSRFSSARGTGMREVGASGTHLWPLRSVHISDPPVHTEMRAVLEASFGDGWLRRLAEPIRCEAAERVAGWRGTVDAVAELCDPLAFGALERMFGEPLPALLPELQRFARSADARYRRDGEPPEAAFARAEQAVWRILDDVVERRRRAPGDDVPSRLLEHGLPHADLMYALRLVAQTAYQTTAVALAAAVAIVAGDLASPFTSSARAADEVLRWSSPVIRFARTVVRETSLAGVQLAAGDRVVMVFASANRDELVFDGADRIDLDRAHNPHVAFGAGPHACAGAALARLQLCATLDALRGAELELVEPPRWFHSSVTAGCDRVLVRRRANR